MASSSETQLHQPGNVITLIDATQLHEFEDLIAAEVNPHMGPPDLEAWGGRTALKDILRPSKFNGRIINIALEVMHNPQNDYCRQQDHGFREPVSHNISHGFNLTADAKSSGRGVVGQIQGYLWYASTDAHYVADAKGRTIKHTYSAGGVRRIFHGPRYEKEQFITFQHHSEAIGFTVLRDAMRRPFRG
jgi:hypothetical protein